MDKFSLRKREIIEKCCSLLADNMREYNFMDQYSRPYEHYGQISYHDNSRPRYDDSRNKFSYARGNFNDYHKRNSTSYHNDKYSFNNFEGEKPVYSGRFKDMFNESQAQESTENKTTEINNAISIIEKPRSPIIEIKRQGYKSDISGFFTNTKDKYEKRPRTYMKSDEKPGYKDYRRSSHKSSKHRRSSSRRSSSRSHHRHRRY